MFFISHRGNISGPNKKDENKFEYIKNALNLGFDVEIDIWYYKNSFYLGHDEPKFKVNKYFLSNRKLWCHAKNFEALINLKKIKANYFWHQKDDYVLTSSGYLWTYPGKKLSRTSIYVLPENLKKFDNSLNYKGICSDYIAKYKKKMNKNFQLIIPVAGPNYDFEKFNNHKLLIDINDKKLVKWVQVSRPYNLSDGIFIFQKKHNKKYDLVNKISKILGKKIRYFILNNYTAGAPQSVLKIKNEIDLKKPLFIDLLDQYIDFKNFFEFCMKNNFDGCVPIFQSLYFNRGYAKIDKQKYITKISEKDPKPISTNSTACVSYFREANLFFENAELMIKKKKLSSNGKYMISLVYNEMIKNNYKIKSYDCEYIASLGSYNSVKSFYENCRLIKY